MEVKNQFILYTATDGKVKLEVFLENETLWLSQKMMAELFEVEVNTINYHLKEIFKSGELEESSVIRKIRITAADADRKKYLTTIYNQRLTGSIKELAERYENTLPSLEKRVDELEGKVNAPLTKMGFVWK